jgi:Leucine-rich repeat (LRR) protein
LTTLPELKHLKKLEILICSYNRITHLPEIESNVNLKKMLVTYNRLTRLPQLPPNLEILDCQENFLTGLPSLNYKLRHLRCCRNQIVFLPEFNPLLERVSCSGNRLIRLPNVSAGLTWYYFEYNPICVFIKDGDNKGNITPIIVYKIMVLNQFVSLFYSLKYKAKLRDWLWLKVRQPRIEAYYAPENLRLLLDSMVDPDDENEFDTLIETW